MANPANNPKAVKVEFLQNHRPGLTSGDYSLQVTQDIQGTNISGNNSFSSPDFYFSVLGDRFSIPPQQIQTVFPPNGSFGDYSDKLPHVVLNRSTLPWERQAIPSKKNDNNQQKAFKENTPWLALLVFYPGELVAPPSKPPAPSANAQQHQAETGSVLTIGDLKKAQAKLKANLQPLLPDLSQEEGTLDTDKTTVIYVKKSTLADLLPNANELQYLAHVRQAKDKDGNLVGNENAFIIAKRLPKKNDQSIIHLVSMENRYGTDGKFNFGDAGDDIPITLVSLKSWRITSHMPKETFEQLLLGLGRDVLSLPTKGKKGEAALSFLKMGYAPLPHFFRRGGQSISFYHSPLAPGKATGRIDEAVFPVRSSDTLLRYDQDRGVFDVSYAAAWELGRLLSLNSKHFSINLNQWKKNHSRLQKIAEQQEAVPHLPYPASGHTGSPPVKLPKFMEDWLSDLSILKGVPFNYLVPDKQMLPPESIRFFCLDPSWISCLIDGAFSIGGATTADHKAATALRAKSKDVFQASTSVCGFLLRSSVVAGWPDLLVDAYQHPFLHKADEDKLIKQEGLPKIRLERLSPNVLICLFEGDADVFDIHLKPERIHFGFDEDTNGILYKNLRDNKGNETNSNGEAVGRINLGPLDKSRVVNIEAIFNLIKQINDKHDALGFKKFTSAQFALELIEGIPLVRFILNN